MYARDHFQVQPSDIFLCSSMKTGCTWLKALSFSIATRTQFDKSTSPLQTTVPHDCIPFLEFGEYSTVQGPRIPLFATHLPYTCLPKSIIDSDCKIVYLCRDPKDTFISMWHYFRRIIESYKQEAAVEGDLVLIEEAFESFCNGISSYGPYWEHVLGFESLSNLEVNKTGEQSKKDAFVQNSAYFRKGKIGDWRNYLSAEMGMRLDNIMEEKLCGSGLTFRISPQE
ncbi:hypothetical protein CRYUN_Cryun36dG0063200 [Craigia yunnanensis]